MKRRRMLAAVLILFLLLRLLPGFSGIWANWISLPLLRALAWLGDLFPFAVFEWMAAGVLLFLLLSRIQKRFHLRLSCVLLTLVAAYMSVWYPLYFSLQGEYSANTAQLAASCEMLIDDLNASDLNFVVPDELPAKFIYFPGWMNLLNITGVCAFISGEALISPELPAASLPFVAVHERMHLRGFAGEGAANIAAWEACMARGGVYADSARIWALRYLLGMLRIMDNALYERCFIRMNHRTLRRYREAGGAYMPLPPSEGTRALLDALGILRPARDYEILASYLAAGIQQ